MSALIRLEVSRASRLLCGCGWKAFAVVLSQLRNWLRRSQGQIRPYTSQGILRHPEPAANRSMQVEDTGNTSCWLELENVPSPAQSMEADPTAEDGLKKPSFDWFIFGKTGFFACLNFVDFVTDILVLLQFGCVVGSPLQTDCEVSETVLANSSTKSRRAATRARCSRGGWPSVQQSCCAPPSARHTCTAARVAQTSSTLMWPLGSASSWLCYNLRPSWTSCTCSATEASLWMNRRRTTSCAETSSSSCWSQPRRPSSRPT